MSEETTVLSTGPRLPLLPFADPLVNEEKELSKIYKCISKCLKSKETKHLIYRGTKNVNKILNKIKDKKSDVKGFVILAGDSYPLDIIAHYPELIKQACEGSVKYIFIESKLDLGKSVLTKRPTCAVMVAEPSKDSEVYKYYKRAKKVVDKANKDEE